MIFSGKRNTNGSVAAEIPKTLPPLSQLIASDSGTSGLASGSATVKPVAKAAGVLAGKSASQPVEATTAVGSALIGQWQQSHHAGAAASRPAGSWW